MTKQQKKQNPAILCNFKCCRVQLIKNFECKHLQIVYKVFAISCFLGDKKFAKRE